MKLFRESISYLAYCLLVAAVALLIAGAWHDFASAFHTTTRTRVK